MQCNIFHSQFLQKIKGKKQRRSVAWRVRGLCAAIATSRREDSCFGCKFQISCHALLNGLVRWSSRSTEAGGRLGVGRSRPEGISHSTPQGGFPALLPAQRQFKPLSRVRLHTCIFAPTCCLGQIHELPKVLQIQRSRHRLRRRGQRTQRPVCMRNTVCFQSRSHAARRRPKYAAGGSIKFTTW